MERSGFHFKFIEKGYEWGSKEERQRATPQLVTPAVPGPRVGAGGNPQHWSFLLLWAPHPSHNSRRARPPERHCRPAHSHTGTQGHSVTTTLKLRGGREERKKKKKDFSSVLLLGTPGSQVWGLCPRLGPFGIRGEQQGAGGYRMGTSTGIMYKGDAPTQPPIGLDWLMGVGCM